VVSSGGGAPQLPLVASVRPRRTARHGARRARRVRRPPTSPPPGSSCACGSTRSRICGRLSATARTAGSSPRCTQAPRNRHQGAATGNERVRSAPTVGQDRACLRPARPLARPPRCYEGSEASAKAWLEVPRSAISPGAPRPDRRVRPSRPRRIRPRIEAALAGSSPWPTPCPWPEGRLTGDIRGLPKRPLLPPALRGDPD
jgi:hypothetical protein